MMTNSDPRDGFFYPTLKQIIDSFSCSPLFLFIHLFVYLFIYVLKYKLPEIPEYAKMQFKMMTLLDVLSKIAWVR